jgi:hypothetical protein
MPEQRMVKDLATYLVIERESLLGERPAMNLENCIATCQVETVDSEIRLNCGG